MKELIQRIFCRCGEPESIKPSLGLEPSLKPEISQESLIVSTASELKLRIENNLIRVQQDIETLRSRGYEVSAVAERTVAYDYQSYIIVLQPYKVSVTKTTVEKF